MNQPYLSLCLIVKNAEKTIGRLLDSVQGAFDEIVIVDTGSTDMTREAVVQALGTRARFPNPSELADGEADLEWWGDIKLASFAWVDDFAAARNFSFGLATGVWRGYLDADDVAPASIRNLKATILDTERRNPNVNCITLPYDYESGEMLQDKIRFVRWADGWKWEDPIHESLQRDHPAPRIHSVITDMVIRHARMPGDEHAALARNIRICRLARAKAILNGDRVLAAKMAYYLGTYASFDAAGTGVAPDLTEALTLLDEAATVLAGTNLDMESRVWAARQLLAAGQLDAALDSASITAGRWPDSFEAWTLLGMVRSERGEAHDALAAFAKAAQAPRPGFRSAHDALLFEGLANVAHARSLLALGRVPEALRILDGVPHGLRQAPRLFHPYRGVLRDALKAEGLRRLREYVDFLVWNCQAPAAVGLLDDHNDPGNEYHSALPASIADMPEVAELRRHLLSRMPQLGGFEAYKAAYASLPAATFHTDPAFVENHVLKLGRAVAVIEWAKSLGSPDDNDAAQPMPAGLANPPHIDDPVTVLSIGFQDGWIEEEVLKANPRIVLTVCDVAPQANEGLQRLVKAFPGRVCSHTMRDSEYDWAPSVEENGGGRYYDAIFCFEVIEHVPDVSKAFSTLRALLKPRGELFLSTPVADHWIEPIQSEVGLPDRPFLGHLRMYNPTQLRNELLDAGFEGEITATDGGAIFLARMRRASFGERLRLPRIAIYVPGTPHPFDPDTLKTQHLGGSETAVIHLSAELAGFGFDVTVFSPRPASNPVIHYRDGVLWRDTADFDAGTDEFDAVLFWRCPALLTDARIKAAPYKKILWLHDAGYGCGPEGYKAADAVVVLSKFHAKIIGEADGFEGPFKFATNGIDPELYQPLGKDAQRDPNLVIYASSPDRGLDHLLGAWREVRKENPDARLEIYYTWELLEAAMKKSPDLKARFGGLKERALGMALQGVELKGGVDQKTLADAFRRASVWAYPTEFPEISCITAMQALAAGCLPVVCETGALPETLGGLGITPPWKALGDFEMDRVLLFASTILGALRAGASPTASMIREKTAQEALRRFAWSKAAETFKAIIFGVLKKETPAEGSTGADEDCFE